MENRADVKSILPFLPLTLTSSTTLSWPSEALASLKALSLGPDVSRVDSGAILSDAILDLRSTLSLPDHPLHPRSADGYALFFDELMSRMDARAWFGDVLPRLARLLMRLPELLEAHYEEGRTGLRVLGQQEAGIVFLSQELIAALLACALLCLFPSCDRGGRNLPAINFDRLFAALHPNLKQSQEQKIKCLIHYFERICLCMPTGVVSFERKVLPFDHTSYSISYPEDVFWRTSVVPLCSFEVFSSGLIEDQQHEALEVDFANEYLGGGALHRGCVQEEIRFMINPELIAGILFMASMSENEAIEIVGVERFSSYMGYGSSFRFVGDYQDKKPFDAMGRRKTRIVAIDALHNPGMRQYGIKCLVRETNKAFCGFYDRSKRQCYLNILREIEFGKNHFHKTDHEMTLSVSDDTLIQAKSPDTAAPSESENSLDVINCTGCETFEVGNHQDNIGIATGNWGCGAFGGDPEIKSMIQWLAASQASRPFIHYYTFEQAALQKLEQVTKWILLHGWTVGDLWSMLVEYSSQRMKRETNVGFLSWVLPGYDASTNMLFMRD